MGTHATAYLAYGIPLEDGETPPNLDDDQWEQLLEEWYDEDMPDYEVIHHCHYDYTMYFLAVPNTEQVAWQGSPKKVAPMPELNIEALYKWETALHALGLNTDTAGWYMMSHYG